ncbi:MAG TPA: DUF4397 domain-containing protein [Gemmatimonadales bacterium]|nr:DUF4397 domain-containing protein [Gemmatimonadales bacterium]
MFRRLLSGLALASLAAACSDSTGPGLGTADVRLINTVNGSPALDLLVGGQVVAQGVDLSEVSSFAGAPAGTQTVGVRATGTTTMLASFTTTLLPGGRYTVLANGSGSTVMPSVVVDTGDFDPGQANLRIINIPEIRTGPDSSSARPPIPVDVYITAPGVDLSTVAPALSLNQNAHSYSSLLYFAPGTWSVRFTEGGTATVLAESGDIAIAAGQIRAVTLYRTANLGYAVSVMQE